MKKKTLLIKLILIILDIKPYEIAKDLNYSSSFTSRLIKGERKSDLFNSWLTEKITEALEIE